MILCQRDLILSQAIFSPREHLPSNKGEERPLVLPLTQDNSISLCKTQRAPWISGDFLYDHNTTQLLPLHIHFFPRVFLILKKILSGKKNPGRSFLLEYVSHETQPITGPYTFIPGTLNSPLQPCSSPWKLSVFHCPVPRSLLQTTSSTSTKKKMITFSNNLKSVGHIFGKKKS